MPDNTAYQGREATLLINNNKIYVKKLMYYIRNTARRVEPAIEVVSVSGALRLAC